MHTRAFSFFFSLFLMLTSPLHAPGHFILAVWALHLTPQGHHSLKSHLTLPEGLEQVGRRRGEGNPASDSTQHPCFSLGVHGLLGVFEGCWFFSPSPPVVKLCHFSVFQMIHWERGKEGLKRTSLAFSSRLFHWRQWALLEQQNARWKGRIKTLWHCIHTPV